MERRTHRGSAEVLRLPLRVRCVTDSCHRGRRVPCDLKRASDRLPRRGPGAKKAGITTIFAPNLPDSVMRGGRKATRAELPLAGR